MDPASKQALAIETLKIAILDETDTIVENISLDMTSAAIKGWDSLAHVRIMMNLEARLNIEIDIDATYRMANLGQLIEHIESKLN